MIMHGVEQANDTATRICNGAASQDVPEPEARKAISIAIFSRLSSPTSDGVGRSRLPAIRESRSENRSPTPVG